VPSENGTELVAHWFNRRWRVGRRDVFLMHDQSGAEVVHDFTDEADAQTMVLRLLETGPPEESDRGRMPRRP
jgi:hypothetical protein